MGRLHLHISYQLSKSYQTFVPSRKNNGPMTDRCSPALIGALLCGSVGFEEVYGLIATQHMLAVSRTTIQTGSQEVSRGLIIIRADG